MSTEIRDLVERTEEALRWAHPLIQERIQKCCGEKEANWCPWCQTALGVWEKQDDLLKEWNAIYDPSSDDDRREGNTPSIEDGIHAPKKETIA